jgi:hypothetical protein
MRLLQKSEKMSFRQAFGRNPDFNYLKRLDPRQKPSGMTIFLQEAHIYGKNKKVIPSVSVYSICSRTFPLLLPQFDHTSTAEC